MKKRKDGRYKKSFCMNGKKYDAFGRTKQEAEENAHKLRSELESGLSERTNPTMNQYYKRWADARIGVVKEATSRSQYFQYKACAGILIPNARRTFGELKLREVKTSDIRTLQKALQEEYTTSNNQVRTRSTQTVNDTIALISHMFNTALKEREVDFNPCVPVRPLKRIEEEARETTHRALTLSEQKAFFEAAKDSFYYDIFRFAVLTGMRCGEIGALKQTDIYNDMIHVKRTITKNSFGAYEIGEDTKTRHGQRDIPLNDDIREVLEHQKNINKMLDGNVIKMNDTIFKAVERGLLMDTPANREIKRLCKRTGIEHFTFHGFRATFATRCIEAGMPPKTLQELLGHADIGITMNLYAHVTDDTKKEAMENLHIAL